MVEAVGACLANSIALLAEAAHMLADCAALALAVVAIRWGRRPPDERRTYGHRRYQPLAAFVNGQALLILLRGWRLADPLLSLLVAALVLRSAWVLTRESANVLLQSVPAGFDVRRIEAELIGHVPGLIEVHDIHVWSMTGELPTVTLHASMAPGVDGHGVPKQIHERLRERLHVEHTTVQVEVPDACGTPTCNPAH